MENPRLMGYYPTQMTTKSLEKMQYQLSVGSLGSYIQWVNTLPMLTLEEEQNLAHRLRDENDLTAARDLILSHLRLVVSIARGYGGYGLSQEDLIQEGNIGLMKAVKRFDPGMGVRLVSFAVHWIRAEMHEFILRNWRIVKIATTKAQRKLFFNLRKYAKKLGWFSEEEINIVANELKVSPTDVRQMEQRLLSGYDESFDTPPDEDEAWQSPAYYLEDKTASPADVLEQNDWSLDQEDKLKDALTSLDERSRDILQRRWLDEKKATLTELAEQYQVSAERIRQLEKTAMAKIHAQLM